MECARFGAWVIAQCLRAAYERAVIPRAQRRFTTLVMPRVLSRLPYGSQTKPVEEFNYEEVPLDARGKALPVPNESARISVLVEFRSPTCNVPNPKLFQ